MKNQRTGRNIRGKRCDHHGSEQQEPSPVFSSQRLNFQCQVFAGSQDIRTLVQTRGTDYTFILVFLPRSEAGVPCTLKCLCSAVLGALPIEASRQDLATPRLPYFGAGGAGGLSCFFPSLIFRSATVATHVELGPPAQGANPAEVTSLFSEP